MGECSSILGGVTDRQVGREWRCCAGFGVGIVNRVIRDEAEGSTSGDLSSALTMR